MKALNSFLCKQRLMGVGMLLLMTSVVGVPVAFSKTQAVSQVVRTMDEDGVPRAFDLVLHGIDAEGDRVTWSISRQPAHGHASVQAAGSAIKVDYQPNNNWHGQDDFLVQVADAFGGESQVRIVVYVMAVNDAPINKHIPVIKGKAAVGSKLRVDHGLWDDSADGGDAVFDYSYQWLRASDADVTHLTPIKGATKQIYSLTKEDKEAYLAVEVTLVDQGGDGIGGVEMSSVVKSALRRVGNHAPVISLAAPEQTFILNSFKYEGNKSYGPSELDYVLKEYLGHAVGLSDLREAAGKVMKHYRSKDQIIANAHIPQQELQNGVVRMSIVEGQLGDVKVAGNQNYTSEFIGEYITSINHAPMRSNDLERALLALNQNAGLKVNSVLERGSKPGEVDVQLQAEDHRPIGGSFGYNNYGSDTISAARYTLGLELFRSTGSHFSVQGMTGDFPRQLAYTSLAYDRPIGVNGMRLEIQAGGGSYDVTKQFADLRIRGKSSTASAYLKYPFILKRDVTLTGGIGLDVKNADFYLLGSRTSFDRVRTAALTLDATFDMLGGKSMVSSKLIQGLGGFLGGTVQGITSSRANADNRYMAAQLSLAHSRHLFYDISLFATASGQWAGDSLVSSEEWLLGGVGSVRGFVPGEQTGDLGYRTSVELRYSHRGVYPWVSYVFLDHGEVWRRTPYIAQPKNDSLTGAGFGVTMQKDVMGIRSNFTFDAGWPVYMSSTSTKRQKAEFNISAGLSY